MSKKLDRILNGPSWTEVILGAVLSIVIGLVLASAYLVFKPVTLVRELPKEPAANMVYYIEGSHESTKARRMPVKQKTLSMGGTVALTEDEINVSALSAAAPKAGEPPAEPTSVLTAGTPNVRMNEGNLQVAFPIRIKFDLFGIDTQVLVQSTGVVTKEGDRVGFTADTLYVGSCPMHRLPLVAGAMRRRIENFDENSPEVQAFLRRVTEISVEGSTLKISTSKS